MDSTILSTLVLPVALGVVMLGLGLSLTVGSFVEVLREPRVVVLVLACQLVVVPATGFALAVLFHPEPALAVGIMLLVATPGGTLANLFSHLAGADVAVNVTLTAITTIISVVSFPLIANLALHHFLSGDDQVSLPLAKVVPAIAVVLVPVALGMLARRRRPALAARLQAPVKRGSAVILVLAIGASVVSERDHLGTALAQVSHVVAILGILSVAVGYWVPRWGGLDHRTAVATSMEIGVHNTPLAIAVALSPQLLDNPTMAFAPAVYSLVTLPMVAVYTYFIARTTAVQPSHA